MLNPGDNRRAKSAERTSPWLGFFWIWLWQRRTFKGICLTNDFSHDTNTISHVTNVKVSDVIRYPSLDNDELEKQLYPDKAKDSLINFNQQLLEKVSQLKNTVSTFQF